MMVFFSQYSLIVRILLRPIRSIGAIFDGRKFENVDVKMCLVKLNPEQVGYKSSDL